MVAQVYDTIVEGIKDRSIVSISLSVVYHLTGRSQSLMAFLRDDINKLVRDKNRRATIQFFAEITRRNVPSQQETLIMAYGQAAR